MKKAEILQILKENRVATTNLKTFINRNKKLKLNYDRCYKWLYDVEYEEEQQKQLEYEKDAAKKFKMSLRKYRELQKKAERILDDFNTGHSMGCHKHLILNGEYFLNVDDTQEYARGSKYQAVHGCIDIRLNKKQLNDIALYDYFDWIVDGKKLVATGYKGTYQVSLQKI